MKTKYVSIRFSAVLLTVLSTLAFPFSALAGEGGTSGGGMGKNAKISANENIRAIIESKEIDGHLRSDGIDEIKLSSIDKAGYHYRISASSIMTEEPCVLDVTVWNTDIATTAEIKITKVKVVSGCKAPVQRESVLEVHKKEFDVFPPGPLDFEARYALHLDAVRKLSPKKRAEIREFMRNSSESKFFDVYTKNAKKMANTVKAHPDMTIGNAMYMLSVVMGIDPNAPGIVIPVIVGLQFAPFFIVDADNL